MLFATHSPNYGSADHGANKELKSEEIAQTARHYLLITNNDLASAFQPLVDRRISQGFSGNLITVETIDSAYAGMDIQEKIRNCIKDHYDPNVSLFVALGGDAIEGDVQNSVVPVRYCGEHPVPADIYYADVDGDNWDMNGNGIYGERAIDVTSVELTSEVYIGRIPVRTSEEASAYVNKVTLYEEAPLDGFANSMIIFSSSPGDTGSTGDARPEGYRDHEPVSAREWRETGRYLNEIQPWWQAVPMHVFCDTKSQWDRVVCGDYNLTARNLRKRLNQANEGRGYHVLIHYAHSSTFGLGVERQAFRVEDAYALKNLIPSVVDSGGCNTAAFDTTKLDPCIGEVFIRNPLGGAVVYFGVSRSMPTQELRTQVYKELFRYDRPYFGEALARAKAVMASRYDENPFNKACKPSKLCGYILLGDPAIRMLGTESGRKIQVFQPKGCEIIGMGDDMFIRWNAVGTGFDSDECVGLDYSDDGGISFYPIPGAEELPYNGCSFVWENCPLPAGTQYRIRVACLSDPNVFHYSEREFTIAELGLLTVNSYPLDGLVIKGTHHNITNYTHSVKIGDTVSLTAPEYMKHLQFSGWSDSQGNTLSTDLTYAFTFTEDATIIAQYGGYSGPITNYYVNDDIEENGFTAGSDLNDGLSPQTPKRHIRTLLESYRDIGRGDVINISVGTYPESITLTEDNSGLTLIGARPDSSVIDAQGQGSCLRLEDCINCTISDLTLTGGNADHGAGIWCSGGTWYSDLSLVVNDCIITGNTATQRGGGLYCAQGQVWISNCLFKRNEAGDNGGGIFIDGWATITNCTISINTASNGAGICCRQNGRVDHCVLSRNRATNNGGGMLTYLGASPTVTNCVFHANEARAGGGVFCNRGEPALTNCIFWGDIPDEIKKGRGEPVVIYSNIQGGWPGEGSGNIDADPYFTDPARGDYHLKSEVGRWNPESESWVEDRVTSPCIDAGDPNSDWTGEPWPHGERINMGAYGGTPEASMSLSTVGNVVDFNYIK